MIRIGVLSDTHLDQPTADFRRRVERCFGDVAMILHAGDLTELAVLEAFADKEIYAVHGNMCSPSCQQALPREQVIRVGGVAVALLHGIGLPNLTDRQLEERFGTVHCIVYGHTHTACCEQRAGRLLMNPGSFFSHRGRAGTYGLLEVDATVSGKIYQVEQPR